MSIRRKTIERKKEVKLRKSFLPTFIITILLWLGVFGIIYFIDPHERGAVPLFFIATLFVLFFTLSIVFINSRRGFIAALAITLFVVLRYFGLGNLLNFLLLAGIGVALELYFSKKLS